MYHPVAGELSYNAGHVKLVTYLRFKKASKVSNLHFENFRLEFPSRKMFNPLLQNTSSDYNPHNNSHFLFVQDDFLPAVGDWLK